MLAGTETGAVVAPDHEPPLRHKGRIRRVIVDVSGEHVEDCEV